jgi:hypothetical protein
LKAFREIIGAEASLLKIASQRKKTSKSSYFAEQIIADFLRHGLRRPLVVGSEQSSILKETVGAMNRTM